MKICHVIILFAALFLLSSMQSKTFADEKISGGSTTMTQTSTDQITVPMDVEWQPAWITWVAATTTCLNALGVECDKTDVAGYSGYAFVMSVHEVT